MPPGVRERLEQALARSDDALGSLRRSDPSGWHITLAFVGELGDERIPALRTAVVDAVAQARLPPLELGVDGAGRFGTRVLFVAVTDRPSGALASLGSTLQDEIERAGLPVERRTVRPHVTLARGGRARTVTHDVVAALETIAPTGAAVRWTPQTVAVYRAIDRDGPARYAVDASVPLAGG